MTWGRSFILPGGGARLVIELEAGGHVLVLYANDARIVIAGPPVNLENLDYNPLVLALKDATEYLKHVR